MTGYTGPESWSVEVYESIRARNDELVAELASSVCQDVSGFSDWAATAGPVYESYRQRGKGLVGEVRS